MRQASKRIPESAEKTVRDIRRATRRHHSAEEKIRIVLEGLRGEDSIAELCRKEGINQNLYYRWSKEFLEAGDCGLLGTPWRSMGLRDRASKPQIAYKRPGRVEVTNTAGRHLSRCTA